MEYLLSLSSEALVEEERVRAVYYELLGKEEHKHDWQEAPGDCHWYTCVNCGIGTASPNQCMPCTFEFGPILGSAADIAFTMRGACKPNEYLKSLIKVMPHCSMLCMATAEQMIIATVFSL